MDQRVPREAKSQRCEEKTDPYDPVQLAGLSIGACEKNPQQVEHYRDHHEVGTPMVERANPPPERELFIDRANRFPRMMRRR